MSSVSSQQPVEPAGHSPEAPRSRARKLRVIGLVALWVLVAIGAVAAGASLWVRRTFGPISIDQMLMNLPGGGVAGGNAIVISGVLTGIVVPLVIVAALITGFVFARRALRKRGVLEGAKRTWVRGVAVVVALAVPVAGLTSLSSTIGFDDYVSSYVRELTTGTSIGDFYVAPPLTQQDGIDRVGLPNQPEGKQQNLVVIYLESIEDAFSDDSLFEKNMLEPIQEATEGWSTIPNLAQYEGGGWTMSGIVSTQCGVPLRTSASTADPNELNLLGAGDTVLDSYLSGAVCLSDVLADRGYRNVYLGGADARFAGKGEFLRTHGYEDVRDLETWIDQGETEINPSWGLSDRRLFELAADAVTELHDAGEPFNLTMLTLDSHEAPYVYDYCEVDTETEMTSITFCSMEQAAAFVDYMDEQGYLEDTAVVIMGDHAKFVAPQNNFSEELSSLDSHTIFNRYWLPGGNLGEARDGIDQMSMFPTLLDIAGVSVPDQRAGMGVSAFATGVPRGSILDLTATEYHNVVTSRSSSFYRELWGETEPVHEAGAPTK